MPIMLLILFVQGSSSELMTSWLKITQKMRILMMNICDRRSLKKIDPLTVFQGANLMLVHNGVCTLCT